MRIRGETLISRRPPYQMVEMVQTTVRRPKVYIQNPNPKKNLSKKQGDHSFGKAGPFWKGPLNVQHVFSGALAFELVR